MLALPYGSKLALQTVFYYPTSSYHCGCWADVAREHTAKNSDMALTSELRRITDMVRPKRIALRIPSDASR
jgi:hypothetical protein